MSRTPILEPTEGAFEVTHPIRVCFGDTDAAGIVYYGTYLRYFEQARAELMRAGGTTYASLFAAGVVMPIIEVWFRYKAPARYDDVVDVRVWVHEVGRASVTVGVHMSRDGVRLGEGGCRLGCVDPNGVVRRLPDALRGPPYVP